MKLCTVFQLKRKLEVFFIIIILKKLSSMSEKNKPFACDSCLKTPTQLITLTSKDRNAAASHIQRGNLWALNHSEQRADELSALQS